MTTRKTDEDELLEDIDNGEFYDDDEGEEYMTHDRFMDLTKPGIYDREPDEPGMDYGPDLDDL